MARKQKKKKVFTLSFDSELMERLDVFCEKERRTRSSAMEIAVERYLEQENREKENVNG